MRRSAAIARISALLDAPAGGAAAGTSMRIPVPLLEAASLAVSELEAAPSTTALAVDALRSRLEAVVMQAALDAHYDRHPTLRASLAELALAAAQLDGHPLAEEPELLATAAAEIVEERPGADADDVLLWAEARRHRAA